jgi:hypothetical protein
MARREPLNDTRPAILFHDAAQHYGMEEAFGLGLLSDPAPPAAGYANQEVARPTCHGEAPGAIAA